MSLLLGGGGEGLMCGIKILCATNAGGLMREGGGGVYLRDTMVIV